jgi:hypothetical protein
LQTPHRALSQISAGFSAEAFPVGLAGGIAAMRREMPTAFFLQEDLSSKPRTVIICQNSVFAMQHSN